MRIAAYCKNLWKKLITDKIFTNPILVIVSYELAATVMECAKELNMVNTQTQWLYVISDTNSTIKSMTRFRTLLNEGDNVAFIYNTTIVKNGCFVSNFIAIQNPSSTVKLWLSIYLNELTFWAILL